MREMTRSLALAALGVAMLIGHAGCDQDPDRPKPAAPRVKIRRKTWFVDMAMTQEQRYTGMSWRREIADDVGMLFVYPHEQVLEFCMRDCYVPLDIAFLDSQRRVVRMQTMRVEPDPAGQITYSSVVEAQYALEVAGGSLARAGVQIGDTVTFLGDVPPTAKAEPPARR